MAVASISIALTVPAAFATSPSTPDVTSLLTSMFTTPNSLIIFVIELALGLGLGYFSIKALKYIIALVAIFFVGVLLNVWQSPNQGNNIMTQLANAGLTWDKVQPVVMAIILTLGLTTVLPITVGFILGVAIAVVR